MMLIVAVLTVLAMGRRQAS